jgi:cholesterol transport system auxiliary component
MRSQKPETRNQKERLGARSFGLPIFWLPASGFWLLASCVSVLPEARPAAPRYLIEPVAYEAGGERVPWSIAVEDPSATRAYDTTKIALVREKGRVEYYAAGEWADRATRLFQTALIRSYENTGRILGVGDRIALPAANFVLHTDIRSLHAAYDGGPPAARVVVYARLADARGRVVAGKLFTAEAKADADRVPQIAGAFDDALGEVMHAIVDWSFAEAGVAYASRREAPARAERGLDRP